jgi:hypothetical protein
MGDDRTTAGGWCGCRGCHPDDLPKGYQTDPRGQAWQRPASCPQQLPPGVGLIGLRQVDGMALS